MGDRTPDPAFPPAAPLVVSSAPPLVSPLAPAQSNRLTLPRWSAWGLVGTWGIYWSAVAAYEVLPAAWKVLVAEVLHRHGTVSLTYSGGLLLPALVIAGPPLLLTVAWLATRPPSQD
jgi:hypothetical protein